MVCNSGVGLTPCIDDKVYHFSAGGLYNGLVLLIDDETQTYWDHITGEALYGTLLKAKMDLWGIQITTVKAALQTYPNLFLLRSKQELFARMTSWVMSFPFAKGKFPPGFRKTMGEKDKRLPEMEIGVGVIEGEIKRFYPMAKIGEGIDDELKGQPIKVQINKADSVPFAQFSNGTRPVQLFTRWYGFSYTFPGCEIYEESAASVESR